MTIEHLWENFKHWLSLQPFDNDITVLHLLIGVFVLYLLTVTIRRVVFSQLDQAATQRKHMSCTSCGWQGQLQVAIRVCPHCGKSTMKQLS